MIGMTPRQAQDGLVELVLPDSGQILVAYGEEIATNPDVEAPWFGRGAVVRMMTASAWRWLV
jgi:hypothetical protein